MNSAASRETLGAAASRLAVVASDGGYSQAALHSRAVVLKAAVDFLSDPPRRRAYDRCLAVGQPQVRCQQPATLLGSCVAAVVSSQAHIHQEGIMSGYHTWAQGGLVVAVTERTGSRCRRQQHRNSRQGRIRLTATRRLQVELLLEDLPGALALLQEAGDAKTVLDWGSAWLAQPSGDAQVQRALRGQLSRTECTCCVARAVIHPLVSC